MGRDLYRDWDGSIVEIGPRPNERYCDLCDCQIPSGARCVDCTQTMEQHATRTIQAIAFHLGIAEPPNPCDPSVARQRKIYSVDLPCTCGWAVQYHYTRAYVLTCPGGGRRFEHAPTDDVAPDENTIVGHLFRDYSSRRLYRIARRVLFHHASGTDYEIEPFLDDPDASATAFTRRLVSSRAIGGSFHHSQKCPCGQGHAR